MTLSMMIIKHLNDLGYSQTEISNRLNITKQATNNYARGIRNINLELFQKIVREFELDAQELIAHENKAA